ncbi:MAG: glycine--tRNA ligase, partial [Methanolinea sp.]
DCWDAEIYSGRFGWVETVGIADRTDYDLRAHERHSGERFSVFIPFPEPRRVKRTRVVPRMGALGPRFRDRAKAIAAALEAADPAAAGGVVRVRVDGEEIEVTPDLYDVREEEIEIPGEEVVPHVIEPSYGIDRMIYAVLEHNYSEEVVRDEERRVLRLPPRIAPIQAAVFPLMNRDNLPEIARGIADSLAARGIVAEYDDSGGIGRRYRRQDEIGTPFGITVDYQTPEDGTVTLRERDSMEQVRVPAREIPSIVYSLVKGWTTFAQLKSP